jgi:hemoglobin
VLALAGCGDDGDVPEETVYDRLGGEAGLRAVVDDFVARIDGDERINGYFRNASLDVDRLARCLVLQLGQATGGPQAYPAEGCRDMASAHAGLGVSTRDYGDLMSHLVAALEAAGASASDVAAVTGALEPHRGDIVEDVDNDATVYQRVGRKPAISAVAADFEERVAADPRVNGFFAGLIDLTRIHACLTRQICAIDGPCKYGEEVDAEFAPLVGQGPCRPMAAAHYGLQDPDGSAILHEHFTAIAENLTMALIAAGVPQSDVDAIIGAIAPLCSDIVAGGAGCP